MHWNRLRWKEFDCDFFHLRLWFLGITTKNAIDIFGSRCNGIQMQFTLSFRRYFNVSFECDNVWLILFHNIFPSDLNRKLLANILHGNSMINMIYIEVAPYDGREDIQSIALFLHVAKQISATFRCRYQLFDVFATTKSIFSEFIQTHSNSISLNCCSNSLSNLWCFEHSKCLLDSG